MPTLGVNAAAIAPTRATNIPGDNGVAGGQFSISTMFSLLIPGDIPSDPTKANYASPTFQGSGTFAAVSTGVAMSLYEPGAALNNKRWSFFASAGNLLLQSSSDDNTQNFPFISVSRTSGSAQIGGLTFAAASMLFTIGTGLTGVSLNGSPWPGLTAASLPLANLAHGAATTGQALVFDGTNWGPGAAGISSVAPSSIGQGGATTGQVLGWSGTAWGPTSLPTAVTPGSATARTTIADTDLIPWYDSAGTDYVALPTTLVSYILAKVDTPVAVTFSSTVTLNCQSGFARNFEVAALTGNVTIANPTNLLNGQTVSIRLPQDGTGSRTATWGSMFKFTGGAKTLSTAASTVDRFVGVYSGNTGLIEGTLLLGIA